MKSGLRATKLSLQLVSSSGRGCFPALREMDVVVPPGLTVLVGGSASGKSLLLLALMGLGPAGGRLEGTIEVEGQRLDAAGWRWVRGRRVAHVPQHPAAALDPTRRLKAQWQEHAKVHGLEPEVMERALEAAKLDPADVGGKLPEALSGGMAQRVLLAFALSTNPTVLIADEPTSALDLEVRADVLDILAARAAAGTAVLVATHDLVRLLPMADRVMVMLAGRLVESGPRNLILEMPRHPYTKALLEGAPLDAEDLEGTSGGCPYRGACPRATARCEIDPRMEGGESRRWACHHPLPEGRQRP